MVRCFSFVASCLLFVACCVWCVRCSLFVILACFSLFGVRCSSWIVVVDCCSWSFFFFFFFLFCSLCFFVFFVLLFVVRRSLSLFVVGVCSFLFVFVRSLRFVVCRLSFVG